jgi:hypothetical protein
MPRNTDSTVEFVYELGGRIEELDVNELAPTLLSLGSLVQQGNRVVYPDGRKLAVNVKPFRAGSFIVDLVVFPQTVQSILNFVSMSEALQIKTLLEWLGLITGAPIGAVQLIRWLRGKPKAVEELGPDEVRYTAYDDRSVTVNMAVHQLVQDNSVNNALINVYVQPLEKEEISEVKTYLRNNEGSAVSVPKEERESIRAFVTNAAPGAKETVKEVILPDVFLNPKRGSFDGDPRDWSFRRGEEVITATIRDEGFIAKCATGEYRLNHHDLLTVDLLERQKVVGTRVQKPTYEILKVKQYVQGEEEA